MTYDEFEPIIYAPIVPMSITTQTIEQREQSLDTGGETPYRFWDSMARKIECGDILMWKSGGFYNFYLSYGIVLNIIVVRETKKVLVLNSKRRRITLWSTFEKTILAKYDNYDIIPKRYRDIWGI